MTISSILRLRSVNVSAPELRNCTSVHDRKHAVLGFMGQHDETLSWLSFSALLLGLYRRSFRRHSCAGLHPGFRGARATFLERPSQCAGHRDPTRHDEWSA